MIHIPIIHIPMCYKYDCILANRGEIACRVIKTAKRLGNCNYYKYNR